MKTPYDTHTMKHIVQHFEDLLGLKLYLVGGSVRDILLGAPYSDLDFATASLPEEIEVAIKKAGFRVLKIGKRFGTLAFNYKNAPENLIFDRSKPIEITTFRTESYGKSRKPQVEYVREITQDLSRRDFTVNAMAVNSNGKLIDPFGGLNDLKSQTIEFVGNPTLRINEDPLRMLRACRLAAQFQFVPLKNTRDKIKASGVKILDISKERWTAELDKILISTHPHRGLDMLMQTELMRFMIPELWIQYHYDQNSPYHRHSLYEHTKITVQRSPADIMSRWAALLHDIGKPFSRIDKHSNKSLFWIVGWKEKVKRIWKRKTQSNYPYHSEIGAELCEKIGRYLKWSNERIETVKKLVLHHLDDDHSPIAKADSAAR